MARPEILKEVFTSGDTAVLRIRVKENRATTPLDLTLITAATYSIFDKTTGLPVLTKILNQGVILENGPDGIVVIVFSAGDTDALIGVYDHELEVRFGNPLKVVTAFQGTITFARDLI